MGDHPHDAFGGKAIDGHLRNLFAHQPEFGDGGCKLLARLRLLRRKSNERLHAADRTAAKPGAAVVQNRHRDLEALALRRRGHSRRVPARR